MSNNDKIIIEIKDLVPPRLQDDVVNKILSMVRGYDKLDITRKDKIVKFKTSSYGNDDYNRVEYSLKFNDIIIRIIGKNFVHSQKNSIKLHSIEFIKAKKTLIEKFFTAGTDILITSVDYPSLNNGHVMARLLLPFSELLEELFKNQPTVATEKEIESSKDIKRLLDNVDSFKGMS